MTTSAPSPRKITKIIYYLDEGEIGVSKKIPYTFSYTIPGNIKSGFHDLTAEVHDDINNTIDSTISINYLIKTSESTNTNTISTNTNTSSN